MQQTEPTVIKTFVGIMASRKLDGEHRQEIQLLGSGTETSHFPQVSRLHEQGSNKGSYGHDDHGLRGT